MELAWFRSDDLIKGQWLVMKYRLVIASCGHSLNFWADDSFLGQVLAVLW